MLLPSGLVAATPEDYEEGWKRLIEPLERATGWKLESFDPGYTFTCAVGMRVRMTLSQTQDLLRSLRLADTDALWRRSDFGRALRDARRAKRWSRVKLARTLHVPTGLIALLESGEHETPPTTYMIRRMGNVLGVDPVGLAEAAWPPLAAAT